MKYDNITGAVFVDRPNRFVAKVDIDGHRETVHVKNTGRCKELLIPAIRDCILETDLEKRTIKVHLLPGL